MYHVWDNIRQQKIKAGIIVSLTFVWMLCVGVFSYRPTWVSHNIQTSSGFVTETWTDGTVYSWNPDSVSFSLTRTNFRYAFVSLTGMAYLNETPFLATLTNANSQSIIINGVSGGFRTYHLLFLSTPYFWTAGDTLFFSLSPNNPPPIVENRQLSIATTNITMTTNRYIAPVLYDLIIFWLLLGVVIILIDFRSFPWYSSILVLSTFLTSMFASIGWWSPMLRIGIAFAVIVGAFPWVYRNLTVFTVGISHKIALFIYMLPALIVRYVVVNPVFNYALSPLITRRIVINFVVVFIVPLIWISMSSYRIMNMWGWNTADTVPTPLILAGFISYPLLSLIIYKLLNIYRQHHVTLGFGGLYVFLSGVLLLNFAPGCFGNDTIANFFTVYRGEWNGIYSNLQLPLLTAFVQIIPWGYNAPFIFHLLLWCITLTYAHVILYRQRRHWIFHMLIPFIFVLPTFLITILNPFHHTTFTVVYVYLTLLLFATISFRKYYQYRFILGISILSSFLAIYRTDSLPIISIIFILILMMILKPSLFDKFGSSFGYRPIISSTTKNKQLLLMCMIVPIIVINTYNQIIPSVLQNNTLSRNMYWNDIAEKTYQFTLIENTLGYILIQPDAKIRSIYREKVERFYNIAELKKWYCPSSICHHWVVNARGVSKSSNTPELRRDLLQAYFGIIIDNPLLFVENRIVHLNTIGFTGHDLQCSRFSNATYNRFVINNFKLQPYQFNDSDLITPFGRTIVNYYSSIIEKNYDQWGKGIWLNVLLYLILLIPIMLTFRITPVISGLVFLLTLRTIVMLFTAQQGFLTYHLPLYVGVFVFSIIWMAALFNRFCRTKR